jgi:hypothetical protein
MPDSIRFLIILLLIGGLGYGALWALAHFPPPQREIVKALPSERLKEP